MTIRNLKVQSPNHEVPILAHIADESDTHWFTTLGTYRKSDGQWICDGRYVGLEVVEQ